MSLFKEKSWSVKLVNGYVLDSQVKAERCRGCESTAKPVTGNNSDKDMMLYGCNGHKCRHMLIRMNFADISPVQFTMNQSRQNIQVRSPAS
jgi:hypothetical protein